MKDLNSILTEPELIERTKAFNQYMQELNTRITTSSLPPSRFRLLRNEIYAKLKEIFKINCKPFYFVGLKATDDDNYSLVIAFKSAQSHADFIRGVVQQIELEKLGN